jgi:hypothetical protein
MDELYDLEPSIAESFFNDPLKPQITNQLLKKVDLHMQIV